MDLTSYAELAVRLANSGKQDQDRPDQLASVEAYRSFVTDWAYLSARVTRGDLDALQQLRTELRSVFAACAAGRDEEAAARLNTLLTRHPMHPEMVRHDGQGWHLHHAESGSVADRYAAAAVMGLATALTDLGSERLRSCEAATCQDVFIDANVGQAKRFCSDTCAAKANVTALRQRRRSQGSTRPPSTAAG